MPVERRPGQIVRFIAPQTPAEAAERFIVLEDRGDRVAVAPTTSTLAIVPTFVYLAADLVVAGDPLGHVVTCEPGNRCPMCTIAEPIRQATAYAIRATFRGMEGM